MRGGYFHSTDSKITSLIEELFGEFFQPFMFHPRAATLSKLQTVLIRTLKLRNSQFRGPAFAALF